MEPDTKDSSSESCVKSPSVAVAVTIYMVMYISSGVLANVPVPFTVDRVKSTCLASSAPTGIVVRVTHTSNSESSSATISMVGIEKEAAKGVAMFKE